MAVNCSLCTASMATAERTHNKRGQAANLHNDCAEIEDMQYWSAQSEPSNRAIIADLIARLTKKKTGLPVQWP